MAAATNPPACQACTREGPCKGRTVPCLSCTDPTAPAWPDEPDSCTWVEWVTGPLLAAVPIGLLVGALIGVLRHFGYLN